MLDRAVSKVWLPHCCQRRAGGRYEQVLTSKKHPLQAVSSQGSPAFHVWAGAVAGTKMETSACHTPFLYCLPFTWVILTNSWLLHPGRWGCGEEGHPGRTTAACLFKGDPKVGAAVYMWQQATTTRAPFAVPSCACPVSPSFIALF